MIKLIELLKEVGLDELEIRSGELSQKDIDVYYAFLEDFNYDVGEFFDDEENGMIDGPFSPKSIRGKVLWEDENSKLVAPLDWTENIYLINPDGRTLFDYVIGFMRVKKKQIGKVNAVQVYMVRVTTPWKGKGFGVKMYYGALDTFKTLISDEILYEGSYNIWANKLAPLGQEPGNFFGLKVQKMLIPLTVEDAKNRTILQDVGADEIVLTTVPPKQLLTLKAKLSGLSISNGDYGVFETDEPVTLFNLRELLDTQTTINGIIEELDLYQVVGVGESYNTIVVNLDDNVVILRQESGKVSMELVGITDLSW
jgi:hypothetical protein